MKVAILFLHGLALPSHVDGLNARFARNIARHLHSKSPESKKNGKAGETLKVHVESINYAQLFVQHRIDIWDRHPFDNKWSISNFMRIVPMKLLMLGMSYLGNSEFRQLVLSQVDSALERLWEVSHPSDGDDDGEEVLFVMCGFSMGATIIFNLLTSHDIARWKSPDCVVTVGCAINWHFPLRPFPLKFLHLTQVPWLNIHYSNDVLASPISEQDQIFSRVVDVEVFPNSAWGRGSLRLSEVVDFVVMLFVSPLRWLWRLFVFIMRLTPLCHSFYFFDDHIYGLISDRILEQVPLSQSSDILKSPIAVPSPVATLSHADNDIEDLDISTHSDMVALNLLLRVESPARQVAKHTVVIYTHGMSTAHELEQEIGYLTTRMKDQQPERSLLSVYSAEWSGVIQRDNKLRFGRRISESGGSSFDVMTRVKKVILSRFAIALSIWSHAKLLPRISHDWFYGIVKLLQNLHEADPSVPIEVVLVGYSIGAIVCLKALGARDVPCASLSFGIPNTRLVGFLCLACPLPWFGVSSDFQLPRFSKPFLAQNPRYGWINVVYDLDACGLSLKKSGDMFDVVTREIVLARSRIPYKKGFRRIRRLEYVAGLNALYLQDLAVYDLISQFIS